MRQRCWLHGGGRTEGGDLARVDDGGRRRGQQGARPLPWSGAHGLQRSRKGMLGLRQGSWRLMERSMEGGATMQGCVAEMATVELGGCRMWPV